MKINLHDKITVIEAQTEIFGFNPYDAEVLSLAGMAYRISELPIQTGEICLAAVTQDPCTLEYVKEQTEAMCLEAVKQYGYALKYVKKQTPEICMAAVKQNGCALQYVKKQTKRHALKI